MGFLRSIVITDVLDVFTVSSKRGTRFHMEDRPSYGLSFCTGGRITYYHEGQTYVSTPENAVLIPMHATYELYNHEDGRFPLIQFSCAEGTGGDRFRLFPISSVGGYEKKTQELRRMLAAEDRLAYMGLFYRMLGDIDRDGDRKKQLLAPVLAYMQEHLADSGMENAALAARLGISEVYLRKLFSECYRTSPRQYLIGLRVEAAKTALLESDSSVEEIAPACGFSSIYHFSRAFRQRTGMTPTEYRSRYVSRSI